MFFFTTNLSKNSDIYARIIFRFVITVLDQTRNAFNTKFLARRAGKEYVRVTLVSM